MSELDISTLRRELNSIDRRLSSEPIIYVKRHGKTAFAIVDAGYMSAMVETIEIMGHPDSYEVFQQSMRDIREGRMHEHRDVEAELG